MGFDVDMTELDKLRSSLDDIKDTLTDGLGTDAFDEVIKESKKAGEGIDDIKESIDAIRPDGIEDTVKELKNTDTRAGDAHDALKKIAHTRFDKTISGLKKITRALGSLAKKAGKLLVKGLAAGTAGVGALTTLAVKSFANYEQLVGGVETLFKDSAGTVQMYADNAYKSAGLSANDYMDTVTAFSASLIQSLGGNTGAAAEYANMAIIDMADNANKMGTEMSSIQDAYQGFAKQNYTMLDNLKLGYGGTKTEMERLLKDATALSGVKYDISSYADIVAAIHVIQTELGITGTTSKEASETISGSFNALKAAWSNTMTSLVLGGDDFDRCVDNLIESAKTFGKNVMPAIIKGLDGMGALITEAAPIIERELPGIVDTLLPPLLKASTALIKGLISALPGVIRTLVDEMPDILKQVWSAFRDAFGEIPGMDKAELFFNDLIGFIQDNSDTIQKLAPALLGLLAAFKLLKKMRGLTGLLGGLFGKLGGAGSGDSIKNAASAMGSIAIAIGGVAAIIAAFAALSQIDGFNDFMASGGVTLKQLCGILQDIGLVGAALVAFTSLVGEFSSISGATSGIGSIAVALGGFTAIISAFSALSAIEGFGDFLSRGGDTLSQLCGIAQQIGPAGAGLVAATALLGVLPIGLALTGLANIALVLGGFTAIIAAFAALSAIDGFDAFIAKGGDTLAAVCGVIGKMAGSIIGGIGEGVTDSLPAIGDNLSAFAASLEPMFSAFSGADTASLSSFASSFAAFIAVLAGEKLVSIVTGGIDYAGLGSKLSTMATGLSGFFTTVATFPAEAYTQATALFDCLAGIKDMPKEGGIMGWFTGAVDYASIASGVQTLADEGMVKALTAITGIPADSYASLTALFDALAGVKQMPTEGGIMGWFKGDSSTGLTNVSGQLPGVAANIASFFANLGGRTDFTPIQTLFDTLSSIKIDSDAASKGFLGLGSSEMEKMGKGLSDFATQAETFLTTVNGLNSENLQTLFDSLATAGELPGKLSGVNGEVGAAFTTLTSTAKEHMANIRAALGAGLDAAVAAFSSKAGAFQASGAYMMSGLQAGMTSKLPALIATARAMAAAIQSAFDVKMQIHSPSKVMEQSGEFVGMGSVIGLRSMIPEAQSAAQDFAVAATPFNDYAPETDAETVYSSRTSSEVTSVAPVFNLSISGTKDDRAMARKVKQFVAEAIQETFESLERKSTVLREV